MFKYSALVVVVCGLGVGVAIAGSGGYGLGRTATKAEIQGWDIDVPPSGAGLPDGSGTVTAGEQIYQSRCAACHGPKGKNGSMPSLVGGEGTLASDAPVKTVGSYWPYATTLYDYIHRAMPLPAPQSLSSDQTYAVTAYVLYLNGIVEKNTTLDADALATVKMPNRRGFISPDPRPDTQNTACMNHCKNAEKLAPSEENTTNDKVPTM